MSKREWFNVAERAQSLVEMAIAAPILIFLLIGLFEVGWALRGYIVLANASRETARFAVRPGYIDFEATDPEYHLLRERAATAVAGMLPLDFELTGTMIVTYISVDTGAPCSPEEEPPCDCELAVTQPYTETVTFTTSRTFPAHSTERSLLDTGGITADMVIRNRRLNCQIYNQDGLPSLDKMVAVEMFYHQPQLFGFPLISNPLTDPVPMYAHTTMRAITGVRGTGRSDDPFRGAK